MSLRNGDWRKRTWSFYYLRKMLWIAPSKNDTAAAELAVLPPRFSLKAREKCGRWTHGTAHSLVNANMASTQQGKSDFCPSFTFELL